jgi:hypothetical protein
MIEGVPTLRYNVNGEAIKIADISSNLKPNSKLRHTVRDMGGGC